MNYYHDKPFVTTRKRRSGGMSVTAPPGLRSAAGEMEEESTLIDNNGGAGNMGKMGEEICLAATIGGSSEAATAVSAAGPTSAVGTQMPSPRVSIVRTKKPQGGPRGLFMCCSRNRSARRNNSLRKYELDRQVKESILRSQ